ncbi:MAG: aldo/keto reductase [Lachnospiraceae bacterium]|jgi:L-glyceraldehyde 3-phosphate reductase|nr:aldo/keto reductase [Lachnospiraceae bacterium]MDD5956631.1 aldo/keto reductase [Lachnospiraceae bacterium]
MYTASESRYEKMKYNRVGRSGLLFPAVSLGFWHNFGTNGNYENMRAMMRTAFDNGITQFDLANNYGPEYGQAEKNAGKLLHDDFMPYRDELIITTKAGYDMWPGPYGNWGSRKYLIASCNQSLKRLGLDYVDIFYHHRPDPDTPLEETMDALLQIVRSGKALYAGISNYNAEQTVAAMKIAKKIHLPLIVNQRRYSIFDRKIEREGLKETAKKTGIGIIAFSPLAQGLLSDRYLNGIPADSRIGHDHRYLHQEDLTEKKLAAISKLNTIAARRGQSLAEMALAWIMRDGAVSSVIIGASRPEQILENVRFLENTSFSSEELAEIDEISREVM